MENNLDFFNPEDGELPGLAPTFTVSEFVAAINQTLDMAYPDVEVEGEVSGFSINQGKFVFFDLKDESASVSCFLMAFNLRVPLEDGMKIKVKATPKLTNKGRFSLTVKKIELSGEGTLKRAYEILKAKLEKEGLFDPARKRPLPQFPKKVGIIASETSAGYMDFQKIANELWGGVEFQLAHVQVQGEAASNQIIAAIEYMNEMTDLPEVIVVLRGGGSLEDLAAFNDEQVARAVATSRVPTLVGVGHEVDITLAGLAADVRASTPSNAAQLLLPDRVEYANILERWKSQLSSSMNRLIDGNRKELLQLIEESMNQLLDNTQLKLDSLSRTLRGYDPRQALKRGYAVARVDGKVLRSGKGLKIGSVVMLELSDAILDTEVKNVSKK